MSKHFEIRFSGSGGQGMMLMGDIMAMAAGIFDNKEILLMKSYGPEARGGACRSELIIDDGEITYPAITCPNLVLAMTQLSCNKYSADVAEDGAMLIDCDLVQFAPDNPKSIYSIPITRISEEVTGKKLSANVVALGAMTAISNCVSKEAMRWAIQQKFSKPEVAETNLRAFDAGFNAIKK